MGKMKITCEEATVICTKSQYGKISLVNAVKLNLHFVYCKICRVFTKQNSQLTKMCSLVKEKQDKIVLSDEEKTQLKLKIKGFEDKTEN